MHHTLQIHIQQHTEFLHFQSINDKETPEIRMTELKPKLDRFIWKLLDEQNRERWLKEKFARKNHNDHISLAYKVRVLQSDQRKNQKIKYEPNRHVYESYVLFQLKNNEHSLIWYNRLTVQFFSFYKEVLDTIRRHIEAFFLLHNFGYRQRKGFGSFTVTSIEDPNGKEKCKDPHQKILEFKNLREIDGFPSLVGMIELKENSNFLGKGGIIPVIYQVLKSGINLNGKYIKSSLTSYLLKNGPIISEKRAIKQILENGKGYKERNGLHQEQTVRATRVVLGMGYNASYQLQNRQRIDVLYTYKRKDGKTLDRFPSPLIFKIINNRIYLYLEENITQYLDDCQLNIKIKHQKESLLTIPVISSKEFQLKAFIQYWLEELEKHRKNRKDHFPKAYLNVLKSINKIEFWG